MRLQYMMRITFAPSLVTAALLLAICPLMGQNTFQRNLQTPDSNSNVLSVAILDNGNIAMGGYVESEAQAGEWDAAIWMLSPQGTTLWAKRFDQNGNREFISNMTLAKDGNILATYASQDILFQSFAGVLKVSPAGEQLWNRRITDPAHTFNGIRSVSAGYLLTGARLSSSGDKALALLLNENGTINWELQYEGANTLFEQAIEDTQGNFLVSGSVFGSNFDGLLCKLNSNGESIWTRTFSKGNTDVCTQIALLADNSILLSGYSNSHNNTAVNEVWLLKTSTSGDVQWSRTYGISGRDLVPNGLQTFADGSALLSITDIGSAANEAAILAKVDPAGNLTRINGYGPTGSDARFGAFTSTNQHHVAVGNLTDGSGSHAYVVKTNLDGHVEICCPRSTTLSNKEVSITATTLVLSKNNISQLNTSNFVISDITATNTNLCPAVNTNFMVSDSSVCINDCVNINLPNPTPNAGYTWSFPTGNPATGNGPNPGQVCYNTPGEKIIELSVNGCPAAVQKVQVANGGDDRVPNAFSPNGDGQNEQFRPLILCESQIEEYYLEIYNRWGDLVFDSFQYDVAWDGKSNGEDSPVDVYFFRATYTTASNGVRNTITKKGDVTLLR